MLSKTRGMAHLREAGFGSALQTGASVRLNTEAFGSRRMTSFCRPS